MKSKNEIVLPFLKWAGGKRWFVSHHAEFLNTPFDRYIEPFLGSGAVFFHLAPRESVLSDRNEELMSAYRAIRDDWKSVERELRRHDRNHSKKYYYEIRESKPRAAHTGAARFIYLNRTCWNGLYRVNFKGAFNVPLGTKTDAILDSDNFEAVANLLKNAELHVGDFEKAVDLAGKGDLLFVDPPYTVKHNLNGFVKYNETLFTWKDQIRLRDSVIRAKKRGANVLLTNAYHTSVRKLYERVGKHYRLDRHSILAADTEKRKRCEELLVVI